MRAVIFILALNFGTAFAGGGGVTVLSVASHPEHSVSIGDIDSVLDDVGGIYVDPANRDLIRSLTERSSAALDFGNFKKVIRAIIVEDNGETRVRTVDGSEFRVITE